MTVTIGRRELLATLGGGAAAWPLAAHAQEPAPTVSQARVGILSASPPTPAMLNAFREGMRERGYIEGQNLYIDVGRKGPSSKTPLLHPNSPRLLSRSSLHGQRLR